MVFEKLVIFSQAQVDSMGFPSLPPAYLEDAFCISSVAVAHDSSGR